MRLSARGVWKALERNNSLALNSEGELLLGGRMTTGYITDQAAASPFAKISSVVRYSANRWRLTPGTYEEARLHETGSGTVWITSPVRQYRGVLLLERCGGLVFFADGVLFSVPSAAVDELSGLVAVRNTGIDRESKMDLVRWSADGTRDWTFTTNVVAALGTNMPIRSVFAMPGGTNFVISVEMPQQDGSTVAELQQLTIRGEIRQDRVGPVFRSRGVSPIIRGVLFQATNELTLASGGYDRILIAGDFSEVAGVEGKNLAVLASDGSLIWSLPAAEGPNGPITVLKTALDGTVFAGGAFTKFGDASNNVVRLTERFPGRTHLFWTKPKVRTSENERSVKLAIRRHGETNAPLSVELVWSTSSRLLGMPKQVRFTPGETEKEIVAGFHDDEIASGSQEVSVQIVEEPAGTLVTRRSATIAIIEDDGEDLVDRTFTPAGLDVPYYANRNMPRLAAQPDGKILVALNPAYHRQPPLVRLHANGTLDGSFKAPFLPPEPVRYYDAEWPPPETILIEQMHPLQDGRTYISGSFTGRIWSIFSAPFVRHVARLNPRFA